MKFKLERLRSQSQNSQQNILSYIFFYITFCYGVCFGFLSQTETIRATALSGAAIPPAFWGFVCITVILAVTATIVYRWRHLAEYVGLAGFSLWLYVLIISIFIGSWFGAAVIALPQVVFWIFWYFGIRKDGGDKPL